MRRVVSGIAGLGLLLGGYAAADVLDVTPGVLTAAPLPTVTPTLPPPTVTVVPPTVPADSADGTPVWPLPPDAPVPSPAGLQAALAPVLADPALAGASVVVADGLTGARLVELLPDQPRVPASATKVLTALAVQRTLPPGTRFSTTVRRGPEPGQILLVAGGDTLLAPGNGDPAVVVGHAGLGELADRTAAALTAHGDLAVVVGLDRTFADGPVAAPTWPPRFLRRGITGPVAALGLATRRAAPGKPVSPDPAAEALGEFVARLGERGITATVDHGLVGAPPEPGESGTPPTTDAEVTPNTAGPDSRWIPGEVLASVESATVTDQLGYALRTSDNALTESLARSAAFRTGAATDFASVGEFVTNTVGASGIDVSGVTLADASGLSRENAVPADTVAEVLLSATTGREPDLAAALDGLPVAALDGTLARRFAGADARAGAGWVRAKTGTLNGVNALAGLVLTADSRLLVFVVLQQGEAGTLKARAALDRFGAVLASCGCR